MFPCIDKIKSILPPSIPDEYLNSVVPIIGAKALSICNCDCESGFILTVTQIDGSNIYVSEDITQHIFEGEYFQVGKQILCAIGQDNALGFITFDEDIKDQAVTAIEVLDIPDALTLAIANEIQRSMVNNVLSESAGNVSVTYKESKGTEMQNEIRGVEDCNPLSGGMVFV